jgi:hypothetical protein
MAPKKEKSASKTIIIQTESIEVEFTGDIVVDNFPKANQHNAIEIDEAIVKAGADINMIGGSKTLGGPTGGDFARGGRRPALGAKHAADDTTADHYGSREETNAALEGKVAIQNTRRLHGHL